MKEGILRTARDLAVAATTVAVATNGAVAPRSAEAGDTGKIPSRPGIVQTGEFGQGYAGPRFTVETPNPILSRPQREVFAQTETQAARSFDDVTSRVRVEASVRNANLQPIKETAVLNGPDGKLQARFALKEYRNAQGQREYQLSESWMKNGNLTEYNPVSEKNIPMPRINTFSVLPTGDVLVGGIKVGGAPSLMYASEFGRTGEWTEVPLQTRDANGEIYDMFALPEINAAVYVVSGASGKGGEIQIAKINPAEKRVEGTKGTGVVFEQITELLNVSLDSSGEKLKAFISAVNANEKGKLYGIDLDKNTYTEKDRKVLAEEGFFTGGTSYIKDGTQHLVVGEVLLGRVNDINVATGENKQIDVANLVNDKQGKWKDFYPGVFYPAFSYVLPNQKGGQDLWVVANRSSVNGSRPAIARVEGYVPGVTPTIATEAWDLNPDVPSKVQSAPLVNMDGVKAFDIGLLGVGVQDFPLENRNAQFVPAFTDLGLERKQRVLEQTGITYDRKTFIPTAFKAKVSPSTTNFSSRRG